LLLMLAGISMKRLSYHSPLAALIRKNNFPCYCRFSLRSFVYTSAEKIAQTTFTQFIF